MSTAWVRDAAAWLVVAFDWLERLAGSWWGAVALFAVALADFVVQAVAWPLIAGKNLDQYLLTYVQLFDRHPLLPWAPLFRGPGAGVVIGPLLSLDGGGLAEPVAAVLFAVSIVAWSGAALWFGRRAAILTAFALLFYPGYGGLFHEFASEIVMATVFSLWVLAVTRAAMRPSIARFALAGLGIAWLVLIRPGNAVLVPFALFPLLLAGRRRQRLAWAGAFAAAACLPLVAWTLQNGWRYGDYTLARGGNAVVPFYRTFVLDKTVSPANGPASRRLAAAIQQHLLTRNPYKAYHVTLKQVLSSGSSRVHEDLYVLSDQVFGWNSAYSTLRDAGWEAIKAHPGTYASSVADTVWQQLSNPVYSTRSQYTPATPDRHRQWWPRPRTGQGRVDPGRPDGLDIPTRPEHPRTLDIPDHTHLRLPQTRPESTLRPDHPRPRDARRQLPPPRRKRPIAASTQPDRPPLPATDLLAPGRADRPPDPTPTRNKDPRHAHRPPRSRSSPSTRSPSPPEPRYMLPVAPTFILLAAAALLGHTRPPDPTD